MSVDSSSTFHIPGQVSVPGAGDGPPSGALPIQEEVTSAGHTFALLNPSAEEMQRKSVVSRESPSEVASTTDKVSRMTIKEFVTKCFEPKMLHITLLLGIINPVALLSLAIAKLAITIFSKISNNQPSLTDHMTPTIVKAKPDRKAVNKEVEEVLTRVIGSLKQQGLLISNKQIIDSLTQRHEIRKEDSGEPQPLPMFRDGNQPSTILYDFAKDLPRSNYTFKTADEKEPLKFKVEHSLMSSEQASTDSIGPKIKQLQEKIPEQQVLANISRIAHQGLFAGENTAVGDLMSNAGMRQVMITELTKAAPSCLVQIKGDEVTIVATKYMGVSSFRDMSAGPLKYLKMECNITIPLSTMGEDLTEQTDEALSELTKEITNEWSFNSYNLEELPDELQKSINEDLLET